MQKPTETDLDLSDASISWLEESFRQLVMRHLPKRPPLGRLAEIRARVRWERRLLAQLFRAHLG